MIDDTPVTAPGRGKPARNVPLFRRLVVRTVQLLLALFVLLHVYALMLRIVPVPATILMVQRAGQGEDVRRHWVPLDKMSPNLVLAVIGAEDAGFCDHGGIDWEAIEKARAYNKKHQGKKRRGGSTISQQTAKNVFFWNGGGMPRKAGEAWMTYVTEAAWGKRRIMEVYLNVAEWGDGIFGAEAAAQARFGKSAADLTQLEAARLAAVLPSPNKWSADKPGPYVRKRTRSIMSRMRVIANEGYAACVLGGEVRIERPDGEKSGTPRPKPELEDIPDAPETGTEALEVPAEAAPEPNANDALNDVLDAADETFNPAAPADAPPEPALETPAPEPDPVPAEPAPEDGGPTVITPQ